MWASFFAPGRDSIQWRCGWSDEGQAVSWHKVKGHAVDAIAKPRWWWPVFEHVPQVAAAPIAHDLHATHALAQIDVLAHTLGC